MNWISVDDRLPHNDKHSHQWVLAVNMDEIDPVPFVVGFTVDWDGNGNFEYLFVTHWLPIPGLPGSDEDPTYPTQNERIYTENGAIQTTYDYED
jgi:hypothetical protein